MTSRNSSKPSIDTLLWRPATWYTVEKGDRVAVSHESEALAYGTVDEFTADRAILWIRHQGTGERQLFLAADGLRLWRHR